MLGGMLMVTGIGCYVFMLAPSITCWIALTGSILFSTLHMMQAYENQESYITYVYNKWVLLLLIAAILEVYATHRIDYLLKKQGKDTH